MKIFLAYVFAFLSMGLFKGLVDFVLIIPFIFFGRKNKKHAPIMTFLESSVSMFLSLWIFIWSCKKIEVQPTFLMFVLPYFAVMRNDCKRLDRALSLRNELGLQITEDGYDPTLQIKMEYGYLAGDATVWFFYVLYLVKSVHMPFFK